VGIYCAIGKRASEIKRIETYLTKHKVRERCLIVASSASSAPGEVYVTPFTAMTHAEYFRDQGRDVLLILDDLSSHAKYYREIGLAARQFPGRESYPGDVFHIQAKLLERAGNFMIKKKSRAITCLPVAESLLGDMTGYIQTNLMSITDGHIYLDTQIFHEGARPAVNVFLSVTRVGRQTQPPLVREVGEKLMTLFKESEMVSRFMRFGSELNSSTQQTVERSRRIRNVFNQVGGTLIPLDLQLLMIMMAWHGYFEGKDVGRLAEKFKQKSFTLKCKTWDELLKLTEDRTKWEGWIS
jgi:F-type H+-transporting ATPase subunit alpha